MELTEPCDDPVLAQDVGWMEAHKRNTVTAAECRLQYETLIEAIRSRERD